MTAGIPYLHRLRPAVPVLLAIFASVASTICAAADSAPAGATTPFTGRIILQAERSTILSSRMAGYVREIAAKDGERFKQGQVLVAMGCAVRQARIRKAEADVRAQAASLESEKQLDALRAGSTLKTKVAKAQLDKARAELEEAEALAEMCVLRAPFDGVVIERRIQPHQNVTEGQPVLNILDNSALTARVIIPSTWLGWLRPETAFRIRLDETNKEYDARVENIVPWVDPASQLVNVIAEIQGTHPELMAGMSGQALFQGPATDD